MDDIYIDALRGVLTDRCTLQAVRGIEGGQSAQALWEAIEESGFADALLPEAEGGAGLSLADAFPLLELCGAFVVPVPLAETMVARLQLTQAGVPRPGGSIALAQGRLQGDGTLVCERVSFGRVADWVLVGLELELGLGKTCLLLPVDAAASAAAVAPLDATLSWSAPAQAAALPVPGVADVRVPLACVLAAQLAGVLMSVFTRTLQYANDRNQFGRPIGKFQAIQHQLGVISEHAFAARMAAQMGCSADPLRVAIAKARTSEAALEVAALSHSIHGAIGFTEEFDLQLYTRRLHAWRQAGGSESYWHDVVGTALVDHSQGLALDLVRATTDLA
ncbi:MULTISPECIES: acyl-CoA dehydrogenase family protein [unclassified Variovorax]|uniref:acyl-CoA dehydrogenase family protein n=1 Tax=unclassified Variovorax TaxID=663243 RepID=UPI003F44993A